MVHFIVCYQSKMYNRSINHYLCSTHHTLASHLLFLYQLNVTSTDSTSTEKQGETD